MAGGPYTETKSIQQPVVSRNEVYPCQHDQGNCDTMVRSNDEDVPSNSSKIPYTTSCPSAAPRKTGGVQGGPESRSEMKYNPQRHAHIPKTSYDRPTSHLGVSGVNIERENLTLLNENYVPPKSPRPSNAASGLSKSFRISLPSRKKQVKFILPYQMESTGSSLDSVGGFMGSESLSKAPMRVKSKRKGPGRIPNNGSFGLLIREPACKLRKCVLTPAAEVELQQLKLKMEEKDQDMSFTRQLLVDLAQDLNDLRSRIKQSKKDYDMLERSIRMLKTQRENTEAIKNDSTSPESMIWATRRAWKAIFGIIVTYLIVSCWISFNAGQKAAVERAQRDMYFRQWESLYTAQSNMQSHSTEETD